MHWGPKRRRRARKKAPRPPRIEDIELYRHLPKRDPHECSVVNLKKLYANGNAEYKRVLGLECTPIFECKICFTLFRSFISFIAHKRHHCTELIRLFPFEEPERSEVPAPKLPEPLHPYSDNVVAWRKGTRCYHKKYNPDSYKEEKRGLNSVIQTLSEKAVRKVKRIKIKKKHRTSLHQRKQRKHKLVRYLFDNDSLDTENISLEGPEAASKSQKKVTFDSSAVGKMTDLEAKAGPSTDKPSNVTPGNEESTSVDAPGGAAKTHGADAVSLVTPPQTHFIRVKTAEELTDKGYFNFPPSTQDHNYFNVGSVPVVETQDNITGGSFTKKRGIETVEGASEIEQTRKRPRLPTNGASFEEERAFMQMIGLEALDAHLDTSTEDTLDSTQENDLNSSVIEMSYELLTEDFTMNVSVSDRVRLNSKTKAKESEDCVLIKFALSVLKTSIKVCKESCVPADSKGQDNAEKCSSDGADCSKMSGTSLSSGASSVGIIEEEDVFTEEEKKIISDLKEVFQKKFWVGIKSFGLASLLQRKMNASSKIVQQKKGASSKTVQQKKGASSKTVQQKKGASSKTVQQKRVVSSKIIQQNSVASSKIVQQKKGASSKTVQQKKGASSKTVQQKKGASSKTVQKKKGASSKTIQQKKGASSKTVQQKKGASSKTVNQKRGASSKKARGRK